MWKDMSGIMHESRPGEFEAMLNNNYSNSSSWPAPRQGQQNSQQTQQATAQNGGNDNVLHRQADIIFLDRPEEMNGFEVKPGYDQVFAGKDDSWFAVKSAVGNGYTIKHYPLQEPKPAPAPVDMAQFVTRAQIEEALPRMIAAEFNKYVQEGKSNGTV